MATVTIEKDIQAATEWKRYERVKSLYSLRDARYRILVQLLGGNFYSNDLITTVPVSSEQASEIAQTTGRQLVVNRLAVVVRNYKNLLSQPPEIDVPPRREPDGSVSKENEAHADKLEKLLYATWSANDMEVQLQGVEHYASGLGSAPIKVWPNIKDGIMQFSLIRPWTFYPMTYGSNYRKYRYVCTETAISGEELLSEYPAAFKMFNPQLPELIDSDEVYLLMEYYDDQVHSLVVNRLSGASYNAGQVGDRVMDEVSPWVAAGPQTVYRIKNILGFVPFINIPGNLIPHQENGEGDIEQSIGLNYYVNDMFMTQADIMAFTGNPILVITGSTMAPSAIPNHPGGAIALPEPGAKAQFLMPPNVAGTYFDQIKSTMSFIEDQTGQPQQMQGRVQASVESGTAIQALLGGVAASVSTKQRIRKVFYQKMNAMALRGYETVFGNQTIDLQGSEGFFSGEHFAVKMKGSEIDGWTANEVIYREGMQDFNTRLVAVLQELGVKLISKRTARKLLAIRSPMEEEAQIRAEQMEEATIAAIGKGGEQTPQKEQLSGGKRLPLGAPSPDQLAAALGGSAAPGVAPPTPEAAGGPTPTGAAVPPTLAPGGGAPEVTEQEVKRALRGVKFSGKVYLISVGPEGIKVQVTRESDVAKVRAALEPLGVPVDVQVVGSKPAEGGTRLRGAR